MGLLKQQLNNFALDALEIDNLSLLETIFDHAPILIFAKDLSGTIIFANRRFEILDGPSPRALVGKNLFDLFPYEVAKKVWESDVRAQKSDEPVYADEEFIHKDGLRHVYRATKFRLLDKMGSVVGTCSVAHDVTEQKKYEYEASHDYLTGLLNRRYLDDTLEQGIFAAGRRNAFFTLALIDLDGFKEVNDTYGHVEGDRILRTVGHLMAAHFTERHDQVYRLGGDEFAITFWSDSAGSARLRVEYFQQLLNKALANALRTADTVCTNSIGLRSIAPNESVMVAQLYEHVDTLLYQQKRSGKNGVYAFETLVD